VVSLDWSFLVAPSVFSNIFFDLVSMWFLWIGHSWLPLLFSLTSFLTWSPCGFFGRFFYMSFFPLFLCCISLLLYSLLIWIMILCTILNFDILAVSGIWLSNILALIASDESYSSRNVQRTLNYISTFLFFPISVVGRVGFISICTISACRH
jgi:hypothetical protein